MLRMLSGVEIVSPDDPARDYVHKRADYAQAGIPEYWIVDPQTETITVLHLAEDAYAERGSFRRGDTASSAPFEDFELSVEAVLDAGRCLTSIGGGRNNVSARLRASQLRGDLFREADRS